VVENTVSGHVEGKDMTRQERLGDSSLESARITFDLGPEPSDEQIQEFMKDDEISELEKAKSGE